MSDAEYGTRFEAVFGTQGKGSEAETTGLAQPLTGGPAEGSTPSSGRRTWVESVMGDDNYVAWVE